MMAEEDFDDDAAQRILRGACNFLWGVFLCCSVILVVEILWNCFARRYELPAMSLAWLISANVFCLVRLNTRDAPPESVPRSAALAAFAASSGMRFEVDPADLEVCLPTDVPDWNRIASPPKSPSDPEVWLPMDLPLLSAGQVAPTNVLLARNSDTEVLCFDLRLVEVSRGRTVAWEQSVIYFPVPIPGLADFTGKPGFDRLPFQGVPTPYRPILRRERYLEVQSKGGRLIVFRPHYLVRPGSYAKWIDTACGIRADLIAAGPFDGD